MRDRICLAFNSLLLLVGFAALIVGPVSAQQHIEELPTGQIASISDNRPATWALSGYDILRLHGTVEGFTPIMRTLQLDARLVEIDWRREEFSLDWGPVEAIGPKVVVHLVNFRSNPYRSYYYLLIWVTPQDAQVEHTSAEALARQWARSAQRALPNILDLPARFGR